MKNQKEIVKEIEAIGLRVKVDPAGLRVYPSEEDDPMILTVELDKLLVIAQKYHTKGHYIVFDSGYIRLY